MRIFLAFKVYILVFLVKNMVSKDEVKNAILKFTNGKTDVTFTKTTIQKVMNTSTKIDSILEELVNEGFIKLVKTTGRAKYYSLTKGQEVKSDYEDLKRALREVLEEYFGKPKTFSDLDKVYDEIKDSLGYAQIKDLREQLGMTIEQFMAKFRDYILQNYELIAGGKEGFIRNGSVYGIIRRKRR